jgi:hypothetical protein
MSHSSPTLPSISFFRLVNLSFFLCSYPFSSYSSIPRAQPQLLLFIFLPVPPVHCVTYTVVMLIFVVMNQ